MKRFVSLAVFASIAMLLAVYAEAADRWTKPRTPGVEYRFTGSPALLDQVENALKGKKGTVLFIAGRDKPPALYDCLRLRSKSGDKLRYICTTSDRVFSDITSAYYSASLDRSGKAKEPATMLVANAQASLAPFGDCSTQTCLFDNQPACTECALWEGGPAVCVHEGYCNNGNPDWYHLCQ